MRVLYIDCFSGISGDMLLGALIDLGVPLAVFEEVIEQLGIPVKIDRATVHRKGIRATRAILAEEETQPEERGYHQLLDLVRTSRLPSTIAEQLESCLHRLAQAEAEAHGIPLESVHFHEIGGLDTLVDLAGTFAGIAYLKVQRVYASPVPLARGSVMTRHGLIPLPAPATLNLLKDTPTYGVSLEGELVTPTGAVLVTTLASNFGPPPGARWTMYGYGAGAKEFPHPNVLRLWLGESIDHKEEDNLQLTFDHDRIYVLETQVDDCNPEFLSYLRLQLEKEGAIDAAFTPTLMKKGRPGVIISVLTYPAKLHHLSKFIFSETTALGLRWYPADRIKLFRTLAEVETPFGRIPVKIGYALKPDGSREYLNIAPEYEVCAMKAQEAGHSIKEVYQVALKAAEKIELLAEQNKP